MTGVRFVMPRIVAVFALMNLLAFEPMNAQQEISISASAVAVMPRSTVLVQGTEEVVSGTWVGGALQLRLGAMFVLEGVGVRGTLVPTDNTLVVDRECGEMRGLLRIEPAPWLGLEGGFAVRAFDSAAGYQKWSIPSVGALLSIPLGHDSFRGYMRGSYLFSVSIDDLAPPNFAAAAEVGVTGGPRGFPLTVHVSYRQERFDFPGGVLERVEQFDLLTISLGLRVSGL